MQEPPSQPQNTSREQVQALVSAEEITQPFWLTQSMVVVRSDRRHLMLLALVSLAGLVFCLLCFPLLFVLNFTTHGSFLETGDMVPLVIMLALTAFLGKFTWSSYAYLPFARQPLLVISREGITVGKTPFLSGAFLSWAEIETIYSFTGSFGSQYLCIRPKHIEQFLSRFTSLERFSRRFSRWIGAPIAIDERMLEISVEEILHQLYFWYASELSSYHY